MQVAVDGLGQGRSDPGNALEILRLRAADRSDRSKGFQQGVRRGLPHTGNIDQFRLQRPLPGFSLITERHTVGFVAHPLEQKQCFAGAREDHGIVPPWQPDLLQSLGQAAHGQLHPSILERPLGSVDLG